MARTLSNQRSWSAEDIKLLKGHYADWTLPHLRETLKRTDKAIKSKAKVLRLTRGNRKIWTAEEDQYICKHYANTATDKIAKHLNRTIAMVYNAAFRLGIEKATEYYSDPSNKCGFKPGSKVGAAFRFEKGHKPANKGLRRPGWAPGRMAETQFKKGALNGTAKNLHKPIGTILADNEGYLRIKVKEHDNNTRGWHKDVWPLLHHKVWKDAGRDIPLGHVVIFKDKDRNNCELDNLELLSQRDNMARNTIWNPDNMPKDIAQLIQLKGAINRQINKAKDSTQHAS